MSSQENQIPRGSLAGLRTYWRFDILSGFLVFLIALPLCLGIAMAYGYPPIAGVFTAIIGGIVTAFISNSELTIKGPAAGLIAIAAPCVMSFGWSGVPGELNVDAYRAALAVGVAAGVIQILMGVFRVGSLGEFFPSSVVHGMLAAIGVIIILKMFPLAIGVKVGGGPLDLLLAAPQIVQHLEPTIAIVGIVSVVIMFLWPLTKKIKVIGSIPAAIVVLAVAIPLSNVLDLSSKHTNVLKHEEEEGAAAAPNEAAKSEAGDGESEKAAEPKESDTLINVPKFGGTFSVLTFPKFDVLIQPAGGYWLGVLPQAWKWVIMFAIIGTLESMLSAKAMDLIDPWQRKTNLDRDNISVGVGNTFCAFIGAAPMISEIVRSRANMDNGARTRYANMWHGIFLLLFVSLLPFVVNMIPVAALMAMLVFTGYRLAHPKEFIHMYKVGPEQLIIFVATIIGVLATDLLMGIGIGIAVKFVIHIINGVPLLSLVRLRVRVERDEEKGATVAVSGSAVFSTWIALRRRLARLTDQPKVVLDLSETRLVDHTVMERLEEMKDEFEEAGSSLVVTGLDEHRAFSEDPSAARKKSK